MLDEKVRKATDAIQLALDDVGTTARDLGIQPATYIAMLLAEACSIAAVTEMSPQKFDALTVSAWRIAQHIYAQNFAQEGAKDITQKN